MFPDVYSACTAASVLRDQTAVDAVELFDRASITCAALVPSALLVAPPAGACCSQALGYA